MERFQGPLSSSFLDEYLEQGLVGAESLLKLEELQASSLEDYNINVQSLVESCITLTNESESNEGRKRKRKNVEQQRMTHIAVERNRRRQMNHHLTVLKSLMPPSYLQRGDQASIIGGAINFVKELKQLIHSLEAQKRPRKIEEVVGSSRLFEHGNYEEVNYGDEIKPEKKSEAIVVEVTQTHAKLKVQCPRRHGQLTKVIVALEALRLTILHLNITSSEATVFYSFNLKIEEDSKLVSASEIAEAVDHIFGSINDTLGSW